LAHTTMVFSRASDDAMIDALIARPGSLPLRELIEYSYPTHNAFIVASGSARGPILMSWSPNGGKIAVIDGEGGANVLTVLTAPR
ncbi:MAG: hypothetical protein ACREQE_11370, partial [Candidatus Binataceae bacterium]